MSTTDDAIDKKLFYDLEWIYMDGYLLTENNYANETSVINKVLFITFSTNPTTQKIFKHNQFFEIMNSALILSEI